jgi:hypothetical protein
MADDGIDAVEVSRAHYESWPGMVLGHYKGFISGQVKEGSGTKMSWRRRMTMLALAPIIERAAERLAPGGRRIQSPAGRTVHRSTRHPGHLRGRISYGRGDAGSDRDKSM